MNPKIEQTIQKIMAIVFKIDESLITKDIKLNEFQPWDSLNHMNLLLTLEDELGIEFTDDEIVSVKSYTDLVSTVSRKIP